MKERIKAALARFIGRKAPIYWTERELTRRPNHFEPEIFLVPLFVRPGSIAVDVGTNVGHYSYMLAKYAGAVVSFEPNRDLWPELRRLLGAGARIEGVALSSHDGSATLRVDPLNTGVATIEEANQLVCVEGGHTVDTRSIPTRTLDSYQLTNVSFLKIDVEGHEESVLAGATETLRREQPILLIESEDRHNPGAPLRIREHLATLGYACCFLDRDRLASVDHLTAANADQRNIGNQLTPYINNFLFLSADRMAEFADLPARLKTLKYGQLRR